MILFAVPSEGGYDLVSEAEDEQLVSDVDNPEELLERTRAELGDVIRAPAPPPPPRRSPGKRFSLLIAVTKFGKANIGLNIYLAQHAKSARFNLFGWKGLIRIQKKKKKNRGKNLFFGTPIPVQCHLLRKFSASF